MSIDDETISFWMRENNKAKVRIFKEEDYMPYIKNERRAELQHGSHPVTAGELNYEFTRIATDYLHIKGVSYAALNDVIGALEGAKLELYRRIEGPYEDLKIVANGDVYGPLLPKEDS